MEAWEDRLLLLSGIQHMAFCERQWALIHIEQVWAENLQTVEGQHFHEKTDDPFEDESRKNRRIIRAMPLVSKELGLRGVADVVEMQQSRQFVDGETCRLPDREGWWRPVPIEYKRGRPKPDDRDAVQLCAQAMALEEMMKVTVTQGFLFYGQTKRREAVVITTSLRQRTRDLAAAMHWLFAEGTTPKARKGKHCSLCSLIELCQPALTAGRRPVASYIARMCRMEVEAT